MSNRLRSSVILAAGTCCSAWGIKKEDKGPIEFKSPIAYPSIRKALPQAHRLAIQDVPENASTSNPSLPRSPPVPSAERQAGQAPLSGYGNTETRAITARVSVFLPLELIAAAAAPSR